jgi:hypothetical protein
VALPGSIIVGDRLETLGLGFMTALFQRRQCGLE